VGRAAFTAAPFSTDPAPAVRSRVTAQARNALVAHPAGAHTADGDAFTVRNMVVDRDGSADVRFDRTSPWPVSPRVPTPRWPRAWPTPRPPRAAAVPRKLGARSRVEITRIVMARPTA
jgi:hypothetical protein